MAEQLAELEVIAEREDKNIRANEMTVASLSIKEIESIPVLFGERDVFKTLQLMPGVKPAGEGSSGFYVRGGSTDQNLILLDEAPVYNASHMMGFFSIFNSDALRDIKLYKGGMGAEYGGRLSSVLDKLLRVYIIDRPMQLWCHVAQLRVEEATDIKPFKQDDDEAIMRAGVSLSQISPLLPHTVEAETANLLVRTTGMIKKQLNEAQYGQTGLESKLLPNWFKRISLEVVKDDVE